MARYYGEDFDDVLALMNQSAPQSMLGADPYMGGMSPAMGWDPTILGGDPNISIMGGPAAAIANAKAQRQRAMLERMALTKQAGGVMVEDDPPNRAYRQPLPFPVTTVAAGVTVSVSANPQRPFRGRRLLIPSSIAEFFSVESLKIGRDDQFVSDGAIPALAFTEVATDIDLKGSTAGVGNVVVIRVTNTDTNSHNFTGLVLGTVLERR